MSGFHVYIKIFINKYMRKISLLHKESLFQASTNYITIQDYEFAMVLDFLSCSINTIFDMTDLKDLQIRISICFGFVD